MKIIYRRFEDGRIETPMNYPPVPPFLGRLTLAGYAAVAPATSCYGRSARVSGAAEASK